MGADRDGYQPTHTDGNKAPPNTGTCVKKIESRIQTDVKIITVPAVTVDCDKKGIEDLQKREFDNLKQCIADGYDITHSTAGVINNIMFVSYVLKKCAWLE